MSVNKKYYYLKLKENFFSSGELILLESMPDGAIYSNILLKLYLLSLKFNGKLWLNEGTRYDAQMIATLTGHEIDTIERALRIFMELGLIIEMPDGTLYMADIEGMVGKSSTEAERRRKARQRVADKCPPEIEKDIESDKELELDSETEREIYGKYKNVSLSPNELSDLKNQYPDFYERYIERLSEYMSSTGKTYSSHFATICSWIRQDNKNPDYSCREGESL